MIIEKLTGCSVEEEIQERFLKTGNTSHLNLKDTFYLTQFYPPDTWQRMVHGYVHKNKHAQYFPLNTDTTGFTLTWVGAAGAITSTLPDVINWVQALYTSNDLLPEKQRHELLASVSMETGQLINPTEINKEIECFGLGIGVLLSPDGVAYTYEGSTIGYRVEYFYVPSTQIVIAAAVNSSDSVDKIDDLIDQAYAVVNGMRK